MQNALCRHGKSILMPKPPHKEADFKLSRLTRRLGIQPKGLNIEQRTRYHAGRRLSNDSPHEIQCMQEV